MRGCWGISLRVQLLGPRGGLASSAEPQVQKQVWSLETLLLWTDVVEARLMLGKTLVVASLAR